MTAKKPKQTTKERKERHAKIGTDPNLEARRREFQAVASHKEPMPAQPRQREEKAQIIHRSRVVGIAITLLIIFVPAIAFAAYYTWYQSADKVVADALYNTLSSNSVGYTAQVDSPTRRIATFNGQASGGRATLDAKVTTPLPDDLSTMHLSLMSTQKDLFFKLPNASQFVASSTSPTQEKLLNVILPIVKQNIDDKWVYMQSNETIYAESITKISTCVVQSLQLFLTNQQSRTNVMQLYAQHAFMSAKEIRTQDTAKTYQITIDHQRFGEFLDAVANAGKQAPFGTCSDEIAKLQDSTFSDAVLELTVDQTRRVVTDAKISLPGNNPMTITAVLDPNNGVTVDEPRDTVRFRDIKDEIITAATSVQR